MFEAPSPRRADFEAEPSRRAPVEDRKRLREDLEVTEEESHVRAEEGAAIDGKMDNPEERAAVKKALLDKLKAAENASARVEVFAHFTDAYGADALVGLFFPEVGDAAIGAGSLAYLLTEASRADVPYTDRAKMAWHQLVDFGIGAIPVVGDVFDFFHGANTKSSEYFKKRQAELVQEALEAGIPREEIEKILGKNAPALKLVKTVGDVVAKEMGLPKKPGRKAA